MNPNLVTIVVGILLLVGLLVAILIGTPEQREAIIQCFQDFVAL
ncbi:hypothetical protein [Sutcliffiella horikoshii]|nr:hypothetical protein [Sutcliffiella horikoshii]